MHSKIGAKYRMHHKEGKIVKRNNLKSRLQQEILEHIPGFLTKVEKPRKLLQPYRS